MVRDAHHGSDCRRGRVADAAESLEGAAPYQRIIIAQALEQAGHRAGCGPCQTAEGAARVGARPLIRVGKARYECRYRGLGRGAHAPQGRRGVSAHMGVGAREALHEHR